MEAISLNDASIQIGAGGGSDNMGEYPVLINFVEGSEELGSGESARTNIWIHAPISMQKVDIRYLYSKRENIYGFWAKYGYALAHT